MREDSNESAIRALHEAVATRLQVIVEFLMDKGLSEFDAINLILDEAELILDTTDMKAS